jgi:hypothetical protein
MVRNMAMIRFLTLSQFFFPHFLHDFFLEFLKFRAYFHRVFIGIFQSLISVIHMVQAVEKSFPNIVQLFGLEPALPLMYDLHEQGFSFKVLLSECNHIPGDWVK